MKEKQGNHVSLLDLHYSINPELETLSDEEVDQWKKNQEKISQDEIAAADFLLNRYPKSQSKLDLDSALLLRKSATVHAAMSRLPNPYQSSACVTTDRYSEITFWLQ